MGVKDMDRVAVMLDERGRPTRVTAPVVTRLRRQAHVSGNQVDAIHCPFCGSGGIVARSDGSIECTFCNSAYTVTVSPVYPSFPMSVNGQPYPWPGRPDGGVDPAMMGDPNAAGGAGYGGQLIPGGGADADSDADADGDSGDGPPWADDSADSGSDDDAADDGGDNDEAAVGGKKKPPFGKKKSVRLYRTASGAHLPERAYIEHLAIATAADPNAMAARIRAERA